MEVYTAFDFFSSEELGVGKKIPHPSSGEISFEVYDHVRAHADEHGRILAYCGEGKSREVTPRTDAVWLDPQGLRALVYKELEKLEVALSEGEKDFKFPWDMYQGSFGGPPEVWGYYHSAEKALPFTRSAGEKCLVFHARLAGWIRTLAESPATYPLVKTSIRRGFEGTERGMHAVRNKAPGILWLLATRFTSPGAAERWMRKVRHRATDLLKSLGAPYHAPATLYVAGAAANYRRSLGKAAFVAAAASLKWMEGDMKERRVANTTHYPDGKIRYHPHFRGRMTMGGGRMTYRAAREFLAQRHEGRQHRRSCGRKSCIPPAYVN